MIFGRSIVDIFLPNRLNGIGVIGVDILPSCPQIVSNGRRRCHGLGGARWVS